MASPVKNLLAPTGVTMRWNNMLPKLPINVSSKRIYMAANIMGFNPLYSRFVFVVFRARTFTTVTLPLPAINLIMNRASWRVATTFPPVYQNPRPNFGQLWPRGENF